MRAARLRLVRAGYLAAILGHLTGPEEAKPLIWVKLLAD